VSLACPGWRVVWPGEASDFTPWLRVNADALAEAVGLDIELTATEHQVGTFFLDVIGRDLTNDCALIVENQLTQTDHGHLGQLLTYAANTDAGMVIWMALSFREEHRQAISFLNELGGEKVRFLGVETGAVCIGDSPVAPLFKLAAQPNDFHAQAAAAARASSEEASGIRALYAGFWQRFLEQLKEAHPTWTRARKGPAENGLVLPSSFGAELSREPLENRRASHIAIYTPGDVTQSDLRDDYIKWFVSSLERLRAALDPLA
jgi:hypothetical protein